MALFTYCKMVFTEGDKVQCMCQSKKTQKCGVIFYSLDIAQLSDICYCINFVNFYRFIQTLYGNLWSLINNY